MLPINRSQHPVFALLFAMLFFFATAPLTWARADNSNDIPTRADVQSQLDTLNKQKELSPQEKLTQQDLTETLRRWIKLNALRLKPHSFVRRWRRPLKTCAKRRSR